jgi:hypothetical protein
MRKCAFAPRACFANLPAPRACQRQIFLREFGMIRLDLQQNTDSRERPLPGGKNAARECALSGFMPLRQTGVAISPSWTNFDVVRTVLA